MKPPNTLPPTMGEEGQGSTPTGQTLAQAARSLAEIIRPFESDITVADAGARLAASADVDDMGQGHLRLQLTVLDAVFHRLLARAVENRNFQHHPKSTGVDEAAMQLALRAQKQYRQSVHLLAALQFKKSENELKDGESDA